MNPTDPDSIPPELGIDPTLPQPPKPLPPPKQQPIQSTGSTVDVSAVGDGTGLVEGVASAGIEAATEIGGAAINAVGTVADAAGSALEGAGSVLDAADGCGGCSLAILVTLFAAAGTAVALFR